MFSENIEARLNEYDSNRVTKSNRELSLEETMETVENGKEIKHPAKVTVKLVNPSILFAKLDDTTNHYFVHKNCTDFAILEEISSPTSPKWKVHILEFKHTINKKSLARILKQFKGGYLKALTHAHFLKPSNTIEEIVLYTCYKEDELSEYSTDPSSLRIASHAPKKELGQMLTLWRSESLPLHTTFDKSVCRHIKIQVDEEYTAERVL